jgi:gelsolin
VKIFILIHLSLQNFAPVAYDKMSYGKFYSGDSYIVLNVSIFGTKSVSTRSHGINDNQFLQTRLSGDKLKWDIHFWLGKDTSQVCF